MNRDETIAAIVKVGCDDEGCLWVEQATTIYDQFIAPLEAERASERARSIKDAEWLETERLAAEAARDEALALLKEARDYTIVTAYCVSSGSLLARIDAALAQPVMEKEEG
jgi:hypothetical protein